ncbi:unnamed protein product [Chrysoparadoxa australica]
MLFGPPKGPPKDFKAIHSQAIGAVQAGLSKGLDRLEVEFPPLASLNKMGDGSAKNRGLMLKSNCDFVKKLAGSLALTRKVWLIACDASGLQELQRLSVTALPGRIEVSSLRDADVCRGDVAVVLAPADVEQWKQAKRLSTEAGAKVVICNGLFNAGYSTFETAYYFKPISSWGYLLRQYPQDWTAYVAGSNAVASCKVEVLQQGSIKRPNLAKVAMLLQSEYNKA